MHEPAEFSLDTEFCKLLERRNDIHLAILALELARDAFPGLNFEHTLAWLARRGEELQGPMARAECDQDLLRQLAKTLNGTHGLHGNKTAFESAECSYLHRVIETGLGIPISLSLVYMEVARHAGLELHGVCSPMHFLTRWDSPLGPLFLDPFHNGRMMRYDECVSWLTSVAGLSRSEVMASLAPASPREIVLRMLNNLKSLHVHREEWEAAWHVQRRLTALTPAAYDSQRDLGLIALKSGRPGLAMDLFERCLKRCPGDDRTMLVRHIDAAQHMLAPWN